MSWKEFLIELLKVVSFDCIMSFILFLSYQYFQRKYNSKLDITLLEEENKYLKEENKKLNGTSTNFWEREDK